jgi:hypothetical protein
MSWRPEDWKNPHLPDGSGVSLPSDPEQIFEAGADAILLKLCKEIEKLKETPYTKIEEGATPEEPAYYHGFGEACDEILSWLRS